MSSQFYIHNFIGRDRELEVLKHVLLEAKSGDATGILLSGRSGIGKTELLRQAFYHYFSTQNDVIPFSYTVKTTLTSLENFSKDYLCSFLVQSLAFLKKDISMIEACVYSFEDIMKRARESEVQWIVDIAAHYEKAKKDIDPLNLFLSTISAPYQSYLISGIPVIVMIDDFHKMRHFCEVNTIGDNKDFWMLFETPAKSRHTPHIFSGNQAELNKMFFEDTLLGEYLELFSLSGLINEDAAKYFTVLCKTYDLDVRIVLGDFIGLFGGSPYYIRNFVQAARQSSRILSEDNFWLIYLNEITKGKTFKYWTSLLKTCIPRFDMRKPSLKFLYHLSKNGRHAAISDIPNEISIRQEDVELIVNLLHTSGIVETGFSESEISDDTILIDIIKGLYHREIRMEPLSGITDTIIVDKRKQAAPVRPVSPPSPSFTLTIPATVKAEYVAVRTIEYIAENFSIASGIIRQLQIALADLFANVIDTSGKSAGNYFLKFHVEDNIFSAEITIPFITIVLTDADRNRIGTYLDDLKAEASAEGTKITFLKKIGQDIGSAS